MPITIPRVPFNILLELKKDLKEKEEELLEELSIEEEGEEANWLRFELEELENGDMMEDERDEEIIYESDEELIYKKNEESEEEKKKKEEEKKKEQRSAQWLSIFDVLYAKRILTLLRYHLRAEDTDYVSTCLAQYQLDAEDETMLDNRDVHIIISTYGGSLRGAYNILCGIINASLLRVCTVNVGKAYSTGSLILAAGTMPFRMTGKDSHIMIHQPMLEETAEPITIGHIQELYLIYLEVLQTYTIVADQSLLTTYRDLQRDLYMDPDEALDHGLIDDIIEDNEVRAYLPKLRVTNPFHKEKSDNEDISEEDISDKKDIFDFDDFD